jgi:2-polyprenyl-6-methoxyphenol hydroxylase-like FAD-dependent oxidoreductase
MPQWDFLNFIAAQARTYPGFHLLMETQATDVLRDGARITGVKAQTPQGVRNINADLVVACDGRSSTIRERARLRVLELGASIDVLWMRVPRRPNDPGQTFGTIAAGGILVTIVRKNGFAEVQARGLDALREQIATLAPHLRDAVAEIRSWDDVKLLTVKVDRLQQWFAPGLLCIGDAAHAMSPVGGVGINLAIQDAVAAANILTDPLLKGAAGTRRLRAVQRRREFPTRVTQALQIFIQERVLNRVLSATAPIRAPLAIRILAAVPLLRRIPARIIGAGIRPEHVSLRERVR